MNVKKFLEELKFLLSDLPEEEREEALDFYRFYFEEAGPEQEASIIAQLGSPEKVAYTIREGLKDKEGVGEYTETGFRTHDDLRAPAPYQPVNHKKEESYEERYKERYGKTNTSYTQERNYTRDDYYRRQEAQRKERKEHRSAKADRFNEKAAQTYRATQDLGDRTANAGKMVGYVLLLIVAVFALVVMLAVMASSFTISMWFLSIAIGHFMAGTTMLGLAVLGMGFIAIAVCFVVILCVILLCKYGVKNSVQGMKLSRDYARFKR